ncbi:MAG: nitrophenyl compound nitroreductase subunit ArsF family protein [Candidatus Diapherotrites archaeon]
MSNKECFRKYSILVFLVILALLSGCIQSNDTTNAEQDQSNIELEQYSELDNTPESSDKLTLSDNIEKIEIIHFHGTNQCYSCITVGNYAEETVNTYFAEELKSGKISFAHINAEQPENFDIVKKYGVTGSSLWIGVYKNDGSFSKEQNTSVWSKINNKSDYMTYLQGIIKNKLEEN